MCVDVDAMEGKPDVTVTSANRKFAAITGSGRKIRDNAADWHNLMLKWEKLNEDGLSAATNIVNIRRSLVEELPSSSSSSSSSLFAGGAAELQDECSKLQYVVDKLVVVVMKMERLMRLQQGIQDLDEFQFGPEGRMCPLFHTWKTGQFESTSRFLLDTFSKELKLKQTILQELAHTASADLCMVYLSCWLHQPFVPPQTRMTLEALLLETGHRSV